MRFMLFIALLDLILCSCSKKQATNDYPKESWVFAGYASPDAALESWTWAMSQGDKAIMLQSLTPEARKEWEKQFAGKTDDEIKADVAKGADRDPGYTIQKRETISDNDVIVSLSMSGSDQVMKMELKKFGNDWKVAGPKSD